MRLGIVGQTARDLVEEEPARAGGAPLYCARALVLLGHPGVVATTTSASDRALVEPVAGLGLPTAWHETAETATFRLTYEGDDRSLAIDSLGAPFTPIDADGWLAEALGDASVVHCGALSRLDFPADTLAALAAQGRRVSLDGQGLVRPARVGPVVLDRAFDPHVLEHVSVLKLAGDEAEMLGVAPDTLAGLGVPEVVLTMGRRGSIVLAGGRTERVAVEEVDARDPTGAGDAFTASYLALRQGGAEPVEAARHAGAVVGRLIA